MRPVLPQMTWTVFNDVPHSIDHEQIADYVPVAPDRVELTAYSPPNCEIGHLLVGQPDFPDVHGYTLQVGEIADEPGGNPPRIVCKLILARS